MKTLTEQTYRDALIEISADANYIEGQIERGEWDTEYAHEMVERKRRVVERMKAETGE